MKTLLLALLCALLATLSGAAQTLPAPATPVPAFPAAPPLQTGSHGTLQITIYLALLLALFIGGVFLLRNGFTLFQPKQKGERKLEISETRMLGNRQFLIVAAYEDRKVLLGVCPGRIDYLCTLSNDEREFPNLAPKKPDA